ncbi:MAG TPA: MMPL family transporter [Solirubrobacteraceae bacterium]
MTVTDRFERVAGRAAARPVLTLAVVVALALAGAALALGLRPSTGIDTFVSPSSSSYQATQAWHRHFGDDSIVILVREPLTDLVETKDIASLTFLEACLAGKQAVADARLQAFRPVAAAQAVPYGGSDSPCGKLMAGKYVQVVYGPGTFLNQAVISVQEGLVSIETTDSQAVATVQREALAAAKAEHKSPAEQRRVANAAGVLQQEQNTQALERLYLNSGIQGLPAIDNASFIRQIVFDPTRGANQPKARFAYLFPTSRSALIEVRLRSSLSDAQQQRAISLIRQAVRMPTFRLRYGGTYTVTGAPVVLNDLAAKITASIGVLLIAALLVMAAVLLLVFRSRLRLLPLAVALAATGITFGAVALVGGSLTMASIAVLPVLIGLAVDYCIQFQSRIEEARRDRGPDATAAVRQAAKLGAPTIATAALATATGFLVLLLSPVPMVQGFGILLVVGIAFAFACSLCVAAAAFVLADLDGGAIGAALRGAADILGDVRRRVGRLLPIRLIDALGNAVAAVGSKVLGGARRVILVSVARPERVLAIGAVLAVAGWAADTQTAVQSDVTKLVPSNMPALRDLKTLEHVTGVSGEIDVTIHARDLTQPRVVDWMISYEQGLLNHFGYVEEKGCARATLCPALSLPDLFSQGTQATKSAGASSVSLSAGAVRNLLAAVPAYFKSAVITPDYRDATVAFGIRLMPLSQQERVISYMRSRLHPPRGVTAKLVGLPVLAAQANSDLSSSSRRLLTLLAGILAVGLVLLVIFRDPRRAVVPLIPIALASGWSALIVFAIGIPLNPMSATLGALVIAISTEFGVLLAERFRQERLAGHDLRPALARTYRSTGAAVIASGITAIAGFGVLVVSDITMLRDFGLVTLIDLSVSLGGVLFVLPAVLVLSERGALRALGSWPGGQHPGWRRALSSSPGGEGALRALASSPGGELGGSHTGADDVLVAVDR